MNYAAARLRQEQETAAYRVYMSNCLGGYVGAKKRYSDWLNSNNMIADNRTAEEIVNDVMAKAGLMFEGGETE